MEDRKERDHPQDLGVERDEDIKTCISYVGWKGRDWIDMSEGRDSGGPCEHSNEPPGSTKRGELPKQLRNSDLLHKECAPWT